MFFDEQGIPILKIALNRILFDDALPEPFSVATQIFRSFIVGVSKIQPPSDFVITLKAYHISLTRQKG